MHERLKTLRKALDLTQQEFADRIGMKQNTIATYEMGRAIPSDPAVRSICREFNVNEEWLRNGTGEMFLPMTRDEQIASFIGEIQMNDDDSFKKRLISTLSQLNENEWEMLARIAVKLQKEKD